jgi:hypothetical protein
VILGAERRARIGGAALEGDGAASRDRCGRYSQVTLKFVSEHFA